MKIKYLLYDFLDIQGQLFDIEHQIQTLEGIPYKNIEPNKDLFGSYNQDEVT